MNATPALRAAAPGLASWGSIPSESDTAAGYGPHAALARTCPHCTRTLPQRAFYPKSITRDGLSVWCRDCNRLCKAPACPVCGKSTFTARPFTPRRNTAAALVPPDVAAALTAPLSAEQQQRGASVVAAVLSAISEPLDAQPDEGQPDAQPASVSPVSGRPARSRKTPQASGAVFNDGGRLVRVFDSIAKGRGPWTDPHPVMLLLTGPSGSGKNVAVKSLADTYGMKLTTVDAMSMVDAESWFGTREVIASDGVSVTAYHPSDFVTAVQQPGIVFIDEANRTMGRVLQIILPLTAGDHSVTNPLTGQRVAKHPDCFIILASNVGMEYVDTYAFDPALLSRSVTVDFTYLPQPDEAKLAIAATGCSAEIAKLWTTFAARTRAMATTPGNDDIPMMSTREVLQACVLQTAGLSADETALAAFVDRQSRVGGDSSVYGRLKLVWTGLRPSQQ